MERVFSDRFTDYDDLKYFTDLQKATVDAKFGVKYEQIVTTPHLVYADFLVNGTDFENRVYEEAPDITALQVL
jgi:hypothetical protein